MNAATLDADVCYRALSSKDERFDGLFFVGVETTGIYCRPICPARTPGKARCRFFGGALEAERAGFRACFRCRPEIAPGTASVDSLCRLSQAAVRLIDEGFLNERSVDELAAELGVSDRHLRRALQRELGVAPIDLAQGRRLALAKQLLHDSDLSITDVALVAGFASIRRFNAAFREKYACTPSALRTRRKVARAGAISLRLDYVAPYAWDAIRDFLAARAIPGVEVVLDGEVRRTFRSARGPGWFSVKPEGRRSLRVELHVAPSAELAQTTARIRRLFDLDARPSAIAEHLALDGRLAPLVARRPGLRVPGCFDGFELAVRAVLGQQISVRAATTLAGRVVETFGDAFESGADGLSALFPTPAKLARAAPASVIGIGLTSKRAETLLALARAVEGGGVRLEPSADPERAVRELEALPGIGPWTAHYIAMRALRWPDAFPSGDLAVRKALGVTTSRDAEALVERLRPWRAYVTMHLWASLSD